MLAQVHATSIDPTDGISEADREHLIQTLAKLRANAEATNARPAPPIALRRRHGAGAGANRTKAGR
ncbi:MAG TPA: hypothetical protein VND88_01915 [Candidatus Acidoferrales bacterium]|nr:hypothetical protein [Candidatus Acidoferrales bacterium]